MVYSPKAFCLLIVEIIKLGTARFDFPLVARLVVAGHKQTPGISLCTKRTLAPLLVQTRDDGWSEMTGGPRGDRALWPVPVLKDLAS